MKIVFLSYLHGFGGAEKQNIMLANSMAERGHDVTVVSICANDLKYPLNEKINCVFLPDRKTNALRVVTRYSDIRRTLKKLNPDVTVSFWFQSAYMTAFMNKRITGKIIYSERGDPGDKEYSGVLGMIRGVSLPRIDGFVFQSKGAQQYFDKRIQKRSVIIPNPVFLNLKESGSIPQRRNAIVTIGRLHPQKNQKLLINAFISLVPSLPDDFRLEIYGDGELADSLQQMIDENKMRDRIILMGTSPDVHDKIKDAALFVLSSDYEGLPNTLLEAMALGVPCISTDCRPGGAREIITDGEDGYIVPVGDARRLAEKMLEVIQNKALQERFSALGKEKMKQFVPSVIYDKWEGYMTDLL